MMQWVAQLSELPAVLLNAALAVLLVLDAIPLVGILVPGDVAVLAAVGAQRSVGGWGVMLAVLGGCLAGWSLTFLVGRFFGSWIRRSRLGAWIGEDRWAAAERMVARGGGRMVVAAPFLPVLNTLIPLAAGGLRMSYRRFLAYAAMGATLWGLVYVALGSVARVVSHLLPGDEYVTVGTVLLGTAIGSVAMIGMRRGLAAEDGPQHDTETAQTAHIETAHTEPAHTGFAMVFGRRGTGARLVRRVPEPATSGRLGRGAERVRSRYARLGAAYRRRSAAGLRHNRARGQPLQRSAPGYPPRPRSTGRGRGLAVASPLQVDQGRRVHC